MSDVTQPELLINALLDGQLDAAQAERVSQQIADDENLSEMFAAFQAQRAAIAELPKYQLGDDFAHQILEMGAAEANAVPMLDRPPASSIDWKKYAMTLAAIAALLMAMLVYQWTPASKNVPQNVAVLDPVEQSTQTKDTAGMAIASESFGFEALPMKVSDEIESNVQIASALPEGSTDAAAVPKVGVRKEAASSIAAMAAAKPEPTDKKTAPANFALRGMAMSPPPQPQPAIDQVWLLEVNDTFSQDQLVTALTSNSISVPTELQQTERNAKNQSPLGDVDGIHVNAKRSQMKRALSQLSLSDAVTISAFQLPSDAVKKQVAVAEEKADVYADAPASIVAPPKAMAQKLRGNFFARTSPSKMPKTFDELEAMMGVDGQDESDAAASSNTDAKQPVAVSAVESDEAQRSRTAAEMDQLFPDDEVDSDELRNFLILIRNSVTPLKK